MLRRHKRYIRRTQSAFAVLQEIIEEALCVAWMLIHPSTEPLLSQRELVGFETAYL
jgi:hypothetical protein